MPLEDHDIRAVLARAQEIELGTQSDAAEIERVIQAAEEVGISRASVERAFRERLNLPARASSVGDLVFARSSDDKYYTAEVLAVDTHGVRVRFLRGSEHEVSTDEIRPCTLLPGERVICPWPWWGPWTCTVLSYDAARQRVSVSDGWGETRDFSITEIWTAPPRAPDQHRATKRKIYAVLLGVGAVGGTIVGAIVSSLLFP